jgi:hypothetical protein
VGKETGWPYFLFFQTDDFLKTLSSTIVRTCVLSLICGGIALSVLASETCEFLQFESINNTTNLGSPFEGASEGWMGIFRYQVVNDNGNSDDGCTRYNGRFLNAPTGTLIASQVCAIIAPCLAVLAAMISASDVLCCRVYGSFIAMSILLLAAAAVQGGTFIIFARPSFCYDSAVKCGVGPATYFSGAAAAAFFLSCILLCCSPRPHPCLQKKKSTKEDDEAMPEAPVITPQKTASGNRTPLAAVEDTQDEGDHGVQWMS